eukprot:12171599-Karenia_brevis.AAC.1
MDKQAVITQFGSSPDLVVSDGKLPKSISSFLGIAEGLSRPDCKFVSRADLDLPGTAGTLFHENVTLSKEDRSFIMWALNQQAVCKCA